MGHGVPAAPHIARPAGQGATKELTPALPASLQTLESSQLAKGFLLGQARPGQ